MDDTYRRGPLLLLSGRANRPLVSEIGGIIGESPDGATIQQFADGEIFARIDQNARGRDVFIIQSTNAPADTIMELLLLADAARRASAARVTAVIPYYLIRKTGPQRSATCRDRSQASRESHCGGRC